MLWVQSQNFLYGAIQYSLFTRCPEYLSAALKVTCEEANKFLAITARSPPPPSSVSWSYKAKLSHQANIRRAPLAGPEAYLVQHPGFHNSQIEAPGQLAA